MKPMPEIAPVIEDEIDIEHTAKVLAEKSYELYRWALQLLDAQAEIDRSRALRARLQREYGEELMQDEMVDGVLCSLTTKGNK